MTWCIKSFQELTNDELYEVLQVRTAIFVVEQKCAYLEVDGKDKLAYHLFKKRMRKLSHTLEFYQKELATRKLLLGVLL